MNIYSTIIILYDHYKCIKGLQPYALQSPLITNKSTFMLRHRQGHEKQQSISYLINIWDVRIYVGTPVWLYTTRKMISSGGASLRSWHQLYSRVLIFVKNQSVIKIPWFWVTNWAGQVQPNGADRLSVWQGSYSSTCSYRKQCQLWMTATTLPWPQLKMNKVEVT